MDTNPGTLAAPFKTITKAINAASVVGPVNIVVASGVYNVANGEVFPIKVANNENLIGAASAVITGGAPYKPAAGDLSVFANLNFAVAFASGVIGSMTGFTVNGSMETVCIDNATVTLANNVFSGSGDVAISIVDGAQATLTSNTIGDGNWAVLITDATTKAQFRGNTFPSSLTQGVTIGYSTAVPLANVDLGTAASPGGNFFTFASSVSAIGLVQNVVAGGVVNAVGNTWRANIQGVDAAGHYASQVIAAGTAAVAGNNYANPVGAIQF